VGLGENGGCLGEGGVGTVVVTPEPRRNRGEEASDGGRAGHGAPNVDAPLTSL
jgi:hypothetical protein